MKIKTSELEGAALDWAVAKCEGIDLSGFKVSKCSRVGADYSFKPNGWYIGGGIEYMPTLHWHDGGPIIDREFIHLFGWRTPKEDKRIAVLDLEDGRTFTGRGNTSLIAAMRCYVASKLGSEVDVPKGLL